MLGSKRMLIETVAKNIGSMHNNDIMVNGAGYSQVWRMRIERAYESSGSSNSLMWPVTRFQQDRPTNGNNALLC